MAEKHVSKYLVNLENQFAASSPVLHQASSLFNELDQLEFDLELIDQDDTSAKKTPWWPIVSTLGGHSASKNDFISRYLGTLTHTTSHKFTVHQYTAQSHSATLPGTALDADHRLPFYQLSRELELLQKGEGEKINSYVELVTDTSTKLQNRLLIDAPVLSTEKASPMSTLLHKKVMDMSDLVLVFCDLFDADGELTNATVEHIKLNQDSNKFMYVIDHSAISLDQNKINEVTISWRKRLSELGLHTGQVVVLTDSGNMFAIDQRVNQLENARNYRILHSLENSIRGLEDKVFPEVEEALNVWKDRAHTTILIVLGFIITLILFAEVSVGVLDLLLDHIIGPLFLILLMSVLLPLHLLVSRVHAGFLIDGLRDRQKKLNLTENLGTMFEKNVTLMGMLLPIARPVDKNKKTLARIKQLVEKCKDMVQELNDQFSHYQPEEATASPAVTTPAAQRVAEEPPAAPPVSPVLTKPAVPSTPTTESTKKAHDMTKKMSSSDF